MVEAQSVGAILRNASKQIDRLDARLLLEHVCGITHATLIAEPGRALDAGLAQRYDELVARRAAGEPLAYLLGSAFFGGLEFSVSSAVLVPRPETEVLVDCGLEFAAGFAAPRVVDLGTGSGIVAVMLARGCPQATVSAVDVSAAALGVARRNGDRHGVVIRWLEGDWYSPLAGERFDLIVSNPPYIAEGDPHLDGDGLCREPAVALSDGVPGGDGMACLEAIVAGAPAHLVPGGGLFVEHGYDQAVKVRELLTATGFTGVRSWSDAAGIERVSGGVFAGSPP